MATQARRPQRPSLSLSLRTRVTAWYGALLAVTLLGFSVLLYFTLERSLSSSLDETLQLRSEQIRRAVPSTILLAQLAPEDVPPTLVEGSTLEELAAPGIYFQVLNTRGGVVYASNNLAGRELPNDASDLAAIRQGASQLKTRSIAETQVRIQTAPLVDGRGEVTGAVQVAQSLAPIQNTMATVSQVLLTGGLGALLLAVVAGWLFMERALQPVARITATARHIAQTGDYRQRLPVGRPRVLRDDELHFLATTFNDMIARLEQVLDSQKRLLADTSHELRNPLTVIRGNLALLLRNRLPANERNDALREAEEEAARMGRMVNDLLLLARSDAGELGETAQREPVPLADIVGEVVERARAPRDNAHHLGLTVMPEARDLLVLGDRDRLKQLLANLVDNALRYTPEGGRVEVSLAVEAGQAQQMGAPGRLPAATSRPPSPMPDPHHTIARIDVRDSGAGIAPEHLPHLFERFYRADPSRARGDTDAGTGLGLAIADSITRAHGGSIQASSEGAGRGSLFTVRLPAIAAPVDEEAKRASHGVLPTTPRPSPAGGAKRVVSGVTGWRKPGPSAAGTITDGGSA